MPGNRGGRPPPKKRGKFLDGDADRRRQSSCHPCRGGGGVVSGTTGKVIAILETRIYTRLIVVFGCITMYRRRRSTVVDRCSFDIWFFPIGETTFRSRRDKLSLTLNFLEGTEKVNLRTDVYIYMYEYFKLLIK